METRVKEEASHHAAILLRGGRQEFDPGTAEFLERDTYAAFDFWRYTNTFDEIIAAPADRLVVGESREEVAEAISTRYTNHHGLSMLLGGEDFEIPLKEEECSWRRRRHYGTQRMGGWRVMAHPVVTHEDWKTEEELETLSMEYNGIWVDDTGYSQLGYENGARAKGFVPGERCGQRYRSDWVFLRYNPRHMQLKSWRKEKERIELLLAGDYPPGPMADVVKALSPATWPYKHRFAGVLEAAACETPQEILKLLKFSKWMVPRRAYWRKYTSSYSHTGSVTFNGTIDHLLIYSYGVVDKARKCLANKESPCQDKRQARAALAFTQWLKREAKALKLKMPDRPVVPPKPENPLVVTRPKPLRVMPDRAIVPILPEALEPALPA